MGKLDGRVALITGAARGQGEAEARLFVELGAKVALTDVLEEQGRAVAADLGDDAVFLPLDVTSETDWEKAVPAVVERFGRIDVLINNAGIAPMAPLVHTSLEMYRRVVEVNQVGVFLGMRTVAPAMTSGGSIINISSIDGIIGTPGLLAYTASKFAVRGMTKAAALELGPLSIRVNSVHPGAIETPMLRDSVIEASGALDMLLPRIPLGRTAEASEVADLVAFLASDESRYCTGTEFVVDGGMIAGTFFPMG
ncbi:MAG TPA: glucose 1-dehydrogenase [Acidimicrobiia bacterium]|nr:glucose 1-dehydrogenase [Acidimicrobiia bacterium]